MAHGRSHFTSFLDQTSWYEFPIVVQASTEFMQSVSRSSVSNISFWFCHSPNSSHCGCRPPGRAGPGRRRRRTAEGGREGLWGIGRKIERKLAARAPPPSVTRVDRPLFSRPPTILEPQGDRRTYVGEFVAPIIEVYPPGACPPGGP